jgi:membrane protease YdiL (CAAX protease family)
MRWWDGHRWTDHVHAAQHGADRDEPVPVRGALVGLVVLVVARIVVELGLRPLRHAFAPAWLLAMGFYLVIFGPMVASSRRGLGVVGPVWRWLRAQLRLADLGWGVLVWLSAVASGMVTVSLVKGLDLPFRSNGEVISSYRNIDAKLFAVTMVAALIGAPLVEELFFRGLVLRGLVSRVPVWLAVALQGLAFGLYHVIPGFGRANVGLVLVLSGYGWVFGTWARHFRRLGPTIVGHALTNTIVFVVLLVR